MLLPGADRPGNVHHDWSHGKINMARPKVIVILRD